MLPAATICLRACQIAQCPGMVAIAGDHLNNILEDLYLNRDLKINRVTQPVTITATQSYGPYALEPDYLRTYDMFYAIAATGGGMNAQGEIVLLNPITMEQMDAEIKNPQISNYPYEFATDMSTQAQTWSGASQGVGNLTSAGQLFVYPATSGSIILTHRYMVKQPDLVNPSTNVTQTPWFPFTKYLINALAAEMMLVASDERYDSMAAAAEKMLQPYLIQEGDEQRSVRAVRLDPRHFRAARGLKPTKSMPFSVAWFLLICASTFFAASPLIHSLV